MLQGTWTFSLNPLSTKHRSYIRDSYAIISKIRKLIIPQDTYLFTMDVNLYTNIDIAEGIEVIKGIFLKYYIIGIIKY